ncbi:hypothetical protein TMatcc_000415 [Talaromyces marneffei ATCC 18224]
MNGKSSRITNRSVLSRSARRSGTKKTFQFFPVSARLDKKTSHSNTRGARIEVDGGSRDCSRRER